jgi:tRNA modification GTPase
MIFGKSAMICYFTMIIPRLSSLLIRFPRIQPVRHLGAFLSDTIYAVSSGQLTKSGVSVVRLSGPSSFHCLSILLNSGPTNQLFPKDRYASLRYLFNPKTKDVIDKAIVLTFAGPKSFTGEDVVELHVHGSRAVAKELFAAIEYMDTRKETFNVTSGLRPADRGEFSRRAFDNGRMDLTEVEGLADLIEAETSMQLRQAFKQMDGDLKRVFEAWRYNGCNIIYFVDGANFTFFYYVWLEKSC